MIRLNFECWWTDSDSLNTRIVRQFVPQEDLNDYIFTNESPDFTIVFGRTEWDKLKTPKERTFYFSQEPLWSPNQPKDGIHNYCSRIFISDKRDYPDRDEYIETLLPMFYAGRGENDTREEWDWSYKIKDKKYEKNKKMSMIVTKSGSEHYSYLCNPETSKINYEFRTKLGIELSNNKEIDIFGTHWENNGENIKGEVWNKHVALDEYVFSVACENSIQKNYISEKFWDIILTDGVPIYLGCDNISEYIPQNCYVALNGMSKEEMICKIKDVVENYLDYYNFHKNNIFELKADFFKNPSYSLWERIKKEIQNA